jgi:DNA-binding GntR family transcriptional regulator
MHKELVMATAGLEALSPGSRLVDRVKARLRTAILEGRFAPGTGLSVPELAKQLGVSRSPVREALVHLLAEGLAVESSRRGISVAERTPQDLSELEELAAQLELGALERLARHGADPNLLDRLERLCAAQHGAIRSGDEALWFRLNNEFHRLIIARCGNGILAAQFNLVANQLRLARADMRRREIPSAGTADHERLVAALRSADAEGVQTVGRAHLAPRT